MATTRILSQAKAPEARSSWLTDGAAATKKTAVVQGTSRSFALAFFTGGLYRCAHRPAEPPCGKAALANAEHRPSLFQGGGCGAFLPRNADEAARPPQQLVVWNGVQNRSLTPWHRLGPLSPTHPQYPYTFKPPIPTDCVGPSHSSCTEECGPDGSFARCGQSRLLICRRGLSCGLSCTSPELLVLPSTKYLRARVNL